MTQAELVPTCAVSERLHVIAEERAELAAHTAQQYKADAVDVARRGVLHIDPRMKLGMLVVANALMFLHVGPLAQACAVVLFALPLLLGGKVATGIRMVALYAGLCAVEWASVLVVDTLPWMHIIGATAAGICMMLPCLIAGLSMFATTRPGDFVCAMRRMHMPDAIVIPVVVIMRFFPTIRHDYRVIRQSMRLRGIATGGMALLRRPMQSLEFILVPLLMNAVNVAHDLTVAALTKGLGSPITPTSMTELRLRVVDWCALVLCSLPLIIHFMAV